MQGILLISASLAALSLVSYTHLVIDVFQYQTANGHEPLTKWLSAIRDKQAQAKLRVRLKRLEVGNFGDCEPVGDGVLELREHLGAGYRVYFG